MSSLSTPDVLPVLTPGRHRTRRNGACFMEYASYLAGERWSDSPACTDPVLAHLARLVNDVVPARDRARLVPLIPSVIGLTGAPRRIGLAVAVRAATAALPIAAETRQRAIAVGLLTIEHALVSGDPEEDELRERIAEILERAPHATRWARGFREGAAGSLGVSLDRVLGRLTQLSVLGIADACVPDAGDRLVSLLANAITDAEHVVRRERRAPAPAPAPRETARTAPRAPVGV